MPLCVRRAAAAILVFMTFILLPWFAKAGEPGPASPGTLTFNVSKETDSNPASPGLIEALALIGDDPGHIRLQPNTAVTSRLIPIETEPTLSGWPRVIPTNVTLEFPPGTGFDFKSEGNRLRILGPVVASPKKIFYNYTVTGNTAGSSSIFYPSVFGFFGGLPRRVEWWCGPLPADGGAAISAANAGQQYYLALQGAIDSGNWVSSGYPYDGHIVEIGQGCLPLTNTVYAGFRRVRVQGVNRGSTQLLFVNFSALVGIQMHNTPVGDYDFASGFSNMQLTVHTAETDFAMFSWGGTDPSEYANEPGEQSEFSRLICELPIGKTIFHLLNGHVIGLGIRDCELHTGGNINPDAAIVRVSDPGTLVIERSTLIGNGYNNGEESTVTTNLVEVRRTAAYCGNITLRDLHFECAKRAVSVPVYQDLNATLAIQMDNCNMTQAFPGAGSGGVDPAYMLYIAGDSLHRNSVSVSARNLQTSQGYGAVAALKDLGLGLDTNVVVRSDGTSPQYKFRNRSLSRFERFAQIIPTVSPVPKGADIPDGYQSENLYGDWRICYSLGASWSQGFETVTP